MPLYRMQNTTTAPQGTASQFTPRSSDDLVPLSLFFARMEGEGDGENADAPVFGFRVKKPKVKVGDKDPMKASHGKWDKDTANTTKGTKGGANATPPNKLKPWKPKIVAHEGVGIRELVQSLSGMTSTGNVATVAVPLGPKKKRLLRRTK